MLGQDCLLEEAKGTRERSASCGTARRRTTTACPKPASSNSIRGAPYVHLSSNETIQGVQFPSEPATSAPLVCDASSDFLYRPIDVAKYGLIYACAQKNAGPSGVTVVIIRDDSL